MVTTPFALLPPKALLFLVQCHIPGHSTVIFILSANISGVPALCHALFQALRDSHEPTDKYPCPCGTDIGMEDTDKLTTEWTGHFQRALSAGKAVKTE